MVNCIRRGVERHHRTSYTHTEDITEPHTDVLLVR